MSNPLTRKLQCAAGTACAAGGAQSSAVAAHIHSIETLGALDGPGIRTVVFISGCPMRCNYCHNPDMWSETAGEIMTANDVCDFCARYKPYYGSEGGVTLSGGEPLMHAEFCAELIRLLHAEGVSVAVDTSGCIFSPEILDMCDLVILDIKRNNAVDFAETCGFDCENTFKTLQYVKSHGIRFWARQVAVPDINADENSVKQFARLAVGAEKAEILPYHTMGANKYEKCGIEYKLRGVPPLSKSRVDRLNALLQSEINSLSSTYNKE